MLATSVRAVALLLVVLASVAAHGQELEPRSYSPAPVGATFAVASFGRSSGDIRLDPALDVRDVEQRLWIATLGFGHVFELAGRQARILALVPSAWGDVSGEIGGTKQRQALAGPADPRFKLSIGLLGAPALSAAELASSPRSAVVGASITVVPPLGDYVASRLVNIGANRWALKPELGISSPRGPWTFEAYAGVWLFTANPAYYPGDVTKRQDPILSLQGHVSYTLPNQVWLALDGTWFSGGTTSIEGIASADLQRNGRVGATVSIPLTAAHSLKVAYTAGATTRRGVDIDAITVTWQRLWL